LFRDEVMSDYGYGVEIEEDYEEAVLRTRLALKAEGFSIITEMHVGGMLGPEAGAARQYLIMGAWGPPTTRRALDAAPDSSLEVAVHLPCNFVVQEAGAGTLVAALDPAEAVEGDRLPAAEAARAALERVFHRVTTST